MIKMNKKTIVTAGLIIAVIIAVCIAAAEGDMGILDTREQTTNLTEYAETVIGVQIADEVIEENGHVELSLHEEYAYICLKLDEGGTDTISGRLKDAGKKTVSGTPLIPGYNGNELARKLTNETVVARYDLFAGGKGSAKTRSMEVYLTKDENGKEYLYLFG